MPGDAGPAALEWSAEHEAVDATFWSLTAAAAGIAVTHTALGPDHYLPFVMLARARGWSTSRTLTVTGLCGAAHVLSSVLLGAMGVAFGVVVGRLDALEHSRGQLAAWALVAFGVAYGSWGLRRAVRRARGLDPHRHGERVHVHAHGAVAHAHGAQRDNAALFWTLFAIFVLGPCEPLIPLFMLPASRARWDLGLWTALVFGVVTVLTMLGLTCAGLTGWRRVGRLPLARFSDALAGGVIAASGLAILILGL